MSVVKWTIGLLIVVGVPLLGAWARRGAPPCCALDGRRIEPLFRVRVVGGDERAFCSVGCAERWLEQTGEPAAVFVTDEASGEELAAARAHFVRSAVVTPPTAGNRTHAFARREDADRHAAAYRGEHLDGPRRPFGRAP